MVNICDIYARGIKESLHNYWSAWLPSTRFELGDVGVLNGYYFEKVGSLKELSIPFTVKDDESSSPLELVSDAGVSFSFKLAGETNEKFEAVPTADAGVKIGFTRQGAFVVNCPQAFEPEVASPMALQSAILKAYEEGFWQADWLVIVRLVRAPQATILISQSASSGIEMSADANLSAGFADLANAEFGISIRSQRGEMIKMIGAQNVTPFFQLGRLKRRLFGASTFKTRSLRAADHVVGGVSPNTQEDSASLYFDLVRDEEFASV